MMFLRLTSWRHADSVKMLLLFLKKLFLFNLISSIKGSYNSYSLNYMC